MMLMSDNVPRCRHCEIFCTHTDDELEEMDFSCLKDAADES